MIKVIHRVVRGAYDMPIVGYLLGVLAGIITLPQTRNKMRAMNKSVRSQRQALASVKLKLAEASTRAEIQQVVDRAIGANDTAIALKGLLPAFMNAIGSVKALAFQVAKTDVAVIALDAKVDAALRLVNDANYFPVSARVPPGRTASATEIVAPEKLALRPLRLNLGCGHLPLDGYVNVDKRRLPGVDIIAPIDQIPIEPGSVDEIYCAHMLEHFEFQRLEHILLPFWTKLLKAGGRFSALVLDADATIRSYAEGHVSFEELKELFNNQDYEGRSPLHMQTPDSLASIMSVAGLVDITVIEAGRRNGKYFEFEISGLRA